MRDHARLVRAVVGTGLLTLLGAGILAAVLVAPRATIGEAPARVRGTVTAIADDAISIRDRDGRVITLKTEPDTQYADVIPSSLDAIEVDDFIGTASKGLVGHWVAVEIMIIPESLRAGRDGFAAWDPLPDTSGDRGPAMTATTMTNGSVTKVSRISTRSTDSSIAAGAIDAGDSRAAGRTLGVLLNGNGEASIEVPSTAPIVRLIGSDRAAISVGSVVFAKTNPGSEAALVFVGRGVTPPM